MFKSPSPLSEAARKSNGESLNATLAEGLDLHSQIKVAHWNVKGMHFASLHPLFETFAVALAAFNDQVAERAVTLGAKAYGTARHVARVSSLPEYPQETTKDTEHVKLLLERAGSIQIGLEGTMLVGAYVAFAAGRRGVALEKGVHRAAKHDAAGLRHAAETLRLADAGLPREPLDRPGQVHRVVPGPLEVVHDLEHGDELAEVRCHGLLGGDEDGGLVLDLDLEGVHVGVARLDALQPHGRAVEPDAFLHE